MPSNTLETQKFIEQDLSFLDMTRTLQHLDPLEVRGNEILAPFQQRNEVPDSIATTAFLEQVIDWCKSSEEKSTIEILAARRDFDKVFGCFLANRQDIFTSHPSSLYIAAWFNSQTNSSPRADFYSYSLGNAAEITGTYTHDPREIALIDIFSRSITATHFSVHSIMRARQAMCMTETDKALEQLEHSLDALTDMHEPLIEAYREVGPTFVGSEVTRYTVGLPYDETMYEGPNPSHSASLVLDRFVLGSFKSILNTPGMQAYIDARAYNTPPHLTEIIAIADVNNDDSSLVELSKIHSPDATEISIEVTKRLRKFKVGHKSYADKALRAKGKVLSADEPDLLSGLIDLSRSKESAS